MVEVGVVYNHNSTLLGIGHLHLTQSNRKKGGGGQGYTRKSWDRVGKRERQAGRAHLCRAGDSGEDEG